MITGRTLTPEPAERVCFNCRAWCPWGSRKIAYEGSQAIDEEPTGQCRVRSPRPGKAEAFGERPAVWPVVAASDWCLKFERAVS